LKARETLHLDKRKWAVGASGFKICVDASNGLEWEKFTVNSLLFTVPKFAPKLRGRFKRLRKRVLREIVRRSHVPFSENLLLISLFSVTEGQHAKVASISSLPKPKAFVRRKKCSVRTQVLHCKGFAGVWIA
jgi:hypothetical protein